MRILLIEDDSSVADFIVRGFKEAGHTIDHADNGKDGLFMVTTESYDILIVDRMLPVVDGLSITRTLRASDNPIPILVLSALGQVDDRVKGLQAGADDYLSKPFAFSELEARITALSRRSMGQTTTETVLSLADLHLDLLSREVRRGDQVITLQPRDFQLLEYLLRHKGQVVTRTMLLENVWDYHFDPQTNVIDVHISRLRAKVDKDFAIPLIHTVRAAGYKIDATD